MQAKPHSAPWPALSLRAKLALVSLVLLMLPWFGYRYVREMERFLLEGQQQTLLGTARAVATALHDRPQLLEAAVLPSSEMASEVSRQNAEELLQRLAQDPPSPQEQTTGRDTPLIDHAPAARGARTESAEITSILKGLERTTSRIWVVNRRYRLLALAGSLKRPVEDVQADASLGQQLLAWLIPPPREDFDEASPDDVFATGKEIANALQGLPGNRQRVSPDGRAVIISAAYPIWSGDEVLGAVVVEESTNSILSVRNRALERLLFMTLAVFAAAAAVLMWFAFRVSGRIRRLRDEAEAAIDTRGRVTRLLSGSQAGDEIGDLSRSFSAVLSRLSQQQAYLETLAGRLSHELRTPVAVVRSSLENLRASPTPEQAGVYITRAEEGLARLSTMLNRMTEATRLEQSLQGAERERYDLCAVVSGCVTGYRGVYRDAVFELDLPGHPAVVEGSPELLAQMLDKLAGNAVDFSFPGRPIRVAVGVNAGQVRLSVANSGPLLPEGADDRLLDAMVSLRPRAPSSQDGEAHLGLGLYVARLIAEYHGGHMSVGNLHDGSGVEAVVMLPLTDD